MRHEGGKKKKQSSPMLLRCQGEWEVEKCSNQAQLFVEAISRWQRTAYCTASAWQSHLSYTTSNLILLFFLSWHLSQTAFPNKPAYGASDWAIIRNRFGKPPWRPFVPGISWSAGIIRNIFSVCSHPPDLWLCNTQAGIHNTSRSSRSPSLAACLRSKKTHNTKVYQTPPHCAAFDKYSW